MNPKNKDDKCFQYTVTITLNYEQIELHLERVSSIKPFINKCKWKGINHPSKTDDWNTFRKLLLMFYILIQELFLMFYILEKNNL